MLNRSATVLAVLLATLVMPAPARSAEAFALKVLGFSPDGRYFAFMQYGPQWEPSRFQADTFLIDTHTDRFVPGSPSRVGNDLPEDATEDNIGPALTAFLASVAKRTGSLLHQHKVSKPGQVIAHVAEARVAEHGSGSDKPGVGSKSVRAKHAKLGDLTLKLDTKEIAWPKTAKLGPHKEAGLCATELDSKNGTAFRLTLDYGGRSVVLNDDKTIPASRHCAMGYGIAEVQTFDRPDGKVTLAVIIGLASRGFEGEDRSFLVVTKVLDR